MMQFILGALVFATGVVFGVTMCKMSIEGILKEED